MRFRRSDLPGIAIAAIAPVALTVLFLEAFDVWRHHGTPLLGVMSTNFALAAGVAAAFSRFVRNWDAPAGLLVLLLLIVLGVVWLQQTGNDGTALATGLKLTGVAVFLALNAAIAYQVLEHGLMPALSRWEARRSGSTAPEQQ